jgi:hypothetical protein
MEDGTMLLFTGQQLLKEKRADEAIALYQFYTKKFPRIVVACRRRSRRFILIFFTNH